jgi:Flp pilus assembly protein TadG
LLRFQIKRPSSALRKGRQRGNALIEFALSATLFFTLFVGVVGFSRVFNIANMAAGAAMAGIQYGSLSPSHNGDLTGIQTAALNDTGNYPGATATASQFCSCSVGGAQVSCPATCSSGSPETYIKVVVTIPYQSIVSLPAIPNPVNVTQSASARVQ